MRSLMFVCLGVTSTLGLAAAAAPSGAKPADTYVVECSFNNPSYSGLCRVEEAVPRSVTVASACKRILFCLNDSRCTRSYCNATTVRGGWQLVKGARQKPTPVKTPPATP